MCLVRGWRGSRGKVRRAQERQAKARQGVAVKVRLGMVWNVMHWLGVERQSWCDRERFGQVWSGGVRQSWRGGAGLG